MIATAKDFDYLLAKLKGTEALRTHTDEEVKEETEVESVKVNES